MSSDRLEAQFFRLKIRKEEHTTPTSGYCMNYVQANVVFLPREYAYDFLLFCQRNPKSCPLLEVTDIGNKEAPIFAPGSDLRTDIPKYNILKFGQITDTVTNILDYWSDDLVSFLLGCSFSFEEALTKEGIELPHIQMNKNVAMYKTSLKCRQAGLFEGNLVVSMRPIEKEQVSNAHQITCRYPNVHGSPIHYGNPEEIGIADLNNVDWGEAIPLTESQIPVFWACGVTPMNAILGAQLPFAITHCPGHMLITDKLNYEMDIFNM